MDFIIRYGSVILSVLFGCWLLNGAGVGFPNWYSAPPVLAKPLTSIIVLAALVKSAIFLCDMFYKNTKINN